MRSRWEMVGWVFAVMLVVTSVFSIGDHLLMIKHVVARGAHGAGPMLEWPF